MADYYQKRPRAQAESTDDLTNDLEGSKALSSEFDLYRQRLVDTDDEGWASELRRYLNDRPANVTKHTDIVTWWQVSRLIITHLNSSANSHRQDHALLYPTLARIALDILPCQASSVPCERLFSASKQSADDRRASLGAKRFEELQVMKFTWRRNIADLAKWNSEEVEEVGLDDYSELLEGDEQAAEWDIEDNAVEFILED
jgi:hypothetical protein